MHSKWMTTVAADGQNASSAGMITLIVFVIGGVIYAFGYARAVMHRANRDYKTTKAAVPTLRKSFWSAWWGAVKVGFWVILAGAILVFWMIRSPSDEADATTTPSQQPSSPSQTHRR